MKQNIFSFAFLAVSVVLVAVVASSVPHSSDSSDSAAIFKYRSNVCASVDRTDGTEYTLPCSHNFFTENGKNIIRDLLGGAGVVAPGIAGTLSNVSQIAVGNVSNAFTDATQFYQDSGLINKSGTFAIVTGVTNQDGNWSISASFTSTADSKYINGTGIYNGSSTGALIFANNTFTAVTLNTNDVITIRWNMSICSSSGC